jgi:hypothetical protein
MKKHQENDWTGERRQLEPARGNFTADNRDDIVAKLFFPEMHFTQSVC